MVNELVDARTLVVVAVAKGSTALGSVQADGSGLEAEAADSGASAGTGQPQCGQAAARLLTLRPHSSQLSNAMRLPLVAIDVLLLA